MPTSHPVTFNGLCVLALESRRAAEVGTLISTYGGRPLVAPALREVPLESNSAALASVQRLIDGQFDMTIFLTGVGVHTLAAVAERQFPRAELVAALSRTKVVVRGPKSVAALRELKVPIWAAAAEPNTWHDVIAAIATQTGSPRLDGVRVAVQEYGVSNSELLGELRARGAQVTP